MNEHSSDDSRVRFRFSSAGFDKQEADQTIHLRFERMAEEFGDRIAIKTRSSKLTYGDLNNLANRISRAIAARCHEETARVALLFSHDADAMAAMIGALKSGRLYMPVDPSFPSARIHFMIENARASLIVANSRTIETAQMIAGGRIEVLNIDEIRNSESDKNPHNPVGPDSYAYILYTSGSTGQPKGVIHTHRNLLHQIYSYTNKVGITASDRLSLIPSYSVGAAHVDIYAALLNGAALYPFSVKEEGLRELIGLLMSEQITVYHSVPTLFRHITDYLTQKTSFPKLRVINLGGESVNIKDIELFKTYFGRNTIFVNSLACTEAGVFSQYFVNHDTELRGNRVPSGYPTEDMEIVLLDEQNDGIGGHKIGEIAIKSRYLSPGYWQNPDMTKTAFKSLPNNEGTLLYRTGDLGRIRSDGLLEHIGRKDFQIKIRGFRVELEEVEAILGQHLLVREVAVIARENEPGDKRLVAYIVPSDKSLLRVGKLRNFLKEKLPDYMIPSAFVMMDSLPLTPNGKVDRKALPLPESGREYCEELFVSPRTPAEEMLACIWCDVLGLKEVGVHDNFFELGGHSLQATQVASRLENKFHVKIPIRTIFEMPTIAELAVRIAQTKSAIVGPDEFSSIEKHGIRRRETNGPCQLSFAQERLWFLDQLEPDSSAYNVPLALRLSGHLNLAALERSMGEMLRRHEVLRTTFAAINEQPVQVISSPGAFTLPFIDLSALPGEQREAKARELAGEEAFLPFDLAAGPLLRATLLQLDTWEYMLLLTVHHIISDRWSMGIFYRELSALYEAFSMGKTSPLPDLPIQYADFAVWQKEWLRGEVLEKQLMFWKEQLDGVSPLELPTDRPRPAVQTFHGATKTFAFPKGLTEALQKLSRKEGVTLFMTLLAAFQSLLHRYTGQNDIVVGTPIANRTRAEIEGLIGFFVNTLVMRTDTTGNPAFRELLKQVQKSALDAYAHQDLPFEKLIQELQPERDLSRGPLFQIMFALQNVPFAELSLSHLSISKLEIENSRTKFDLEVYLEETKEGLTGEFVYNTDLFDAATIERIIGHYQMILEGIIADPDRRVSELPLLTDEERYRILVEWNDTAAQYPEDKCIHQLFEEQVERTPDAIAVVFDKQQLTYRELNNKANQLAYYLRQRRVGPEVLVGLCMERSLEMVVGLLGILKAGGAYVPLDPLYPSQRIVFMLQDSEAAVLVTQKRLLERIPGMGVQIVCMDSDLDEISHEQTSNPAPLARPDDLVYVIYTSGSTGKPKGVAVPHSALVNHLCSMQKEPGLTAHDVLLSVTTLSFDIAALELYLPLITGAQIVLVSREVAMEGSRLIAQLEQHNATVMQATPATWQLMLQAGWKGNRNLKILCGGEAMPEEMADDLLCMSREVWNMYGPTETTIWSTVWRVGPDKGRMLIGRPIANTHTYILDRHKNPLPAGVRGELFIGGSGLAREYLKRPDLTMQKFISNPFRGILPHGEHASERIFNTGDLARWLPDGQIECLGRIDHQVKIRGYRIELGEIEAAISADPMVARSVVVAREDTPGEKHLVAYIVAHKEAPAIDTLRQELKRVLPDHMIPSAFVLMNQLPLTPNGKVDRKALPAPELSQAHMEQSFVAPRTPIEEIMAGIWCAVFGLKRVCIHDNFFELGGHSLLATKVISRMRKAFNVEIPLRSLFEMPNIAGLAGIIEEIQGAGEQQFEQIEPVSREGDMPLSFAQERLWLYDQLEPNMPNIIPCAIRLHGNLDQQALQKGLDEIVNRHAVLRTTFSSATGEALQVIRSGCSVHMTIADLEAQPVPEQDKALQSIIDSEVARPFDLSNDLMLRVTLIRSSDKEHVLLLTIHHIATDGLSMEIFFRELAALYIAIAEGRPSTLPCLPVQYADFACWQRKRLRGEFLEKQLLYWKEQLAGIAEVLDLPSDRTRPEIRSYKGASCKMPLPDILVDRLRLLSYQECVTMFTLMMTAFKVLLYRFTGQEDICVGTFATNRNRVELEGLIGFFVNTLVMRTDLGGNPDFLELLHREHAVNMGAFAHQDVPFEKLIEALKPKRALSHTPFFQAALSFNTIPKTTFELPGMSFEFMSLENRASLYDLSLIINDTADGMEVCFSYRTDIFNASTIMQWACTFRTLLESIVANPHQRIGALSLMTDSEKRQMIKEWNAGVDYEDGLRLHEMIEDRVKIDPDAPAVVFNDCQLTYRELNSRANRLARFLRKQGVGPEVFVCICVERSLEMIVGILGVLKAGGAYVPLDPTYPAERVKLILSDTDSSLLLTQERLCGELQSQNVKMVLLDTDWNEISLEEDGDLSQPAIPHSAVYAIYTSGSTGRPKAVVVEHKALMNYTRAAISEYGIRPADRVLQFASPSFDASAEEIYPCLVQGATLILRNDAMLNSASDFFHTCAEWKITVLSLPTAYWHKLMADMETGDACLSESLRLVIIGGEAALPERLATWHRHVGSKVRLLNTYGPTEATVVATMCDLTHLASGDITAQKIPIGRPIPNVSTYVLDSSLQPVPAGVPGELFIGGNGLARGYLNRPGLTAEKFMPDPFSDEPTALIYRTGDLARYLADGNIEFLGRVDSQVKIRGYRIEPGEVEAALTQEPSVREAVVIAREEQRGDKRLVAYVVLSDKSTVTTSILRNFLKDKLPNYMIPSAFVIMDSLPMTPNGKVDRNALPVPESVQENMEVPFVAPRTPVEEMLAGIWREVLGLKEVGINDNFFELGGHSLLATQVMSRLRKAFRVEVPLRSLFEMPTIEGLAIRITQSQVEDANADELDRLLAELEVSAPKTVSESNGIGIKENENFQ
jgi:amino acid adenylation domain-containing protein